MSKLAKLRKSRNSWKQKAIDRGKTVRYQRKEQRRLKRERDQYKHLARCAMDQLAKARRPSPAPVSTKADLVWLSLQLFLVVHLSFRAVSRVLDVLGGHLGIAKAPSPQTVSSWVTRLSMARIRVGSQPGISLVPETRYSSGAIWLIDTSIALGDGKILAVLALNVHHYLVYTRAPTLAQVTCLAVCVASSWTGERIANCCTM